MNNLEYLEEAKKRDKELGIEIDRIANNSYPNNINWARKFRMTFRQVKALEIIAEELCKHNNHLNKFKKELDSANKLSKDFESKRLKPKIQIKVNKKTLNKYMKKTSI